ncbi:MAG: ABC transporter permease [Planctomycetota bacterium]
MPLHLVLKNLFAHKLRTVLTLLSILVAIFLICILRSVVTSLEAGVEAASARRLVVQSAVSLFVDLPLSYQSKIAAVEGVDGICKWQWFGGVYQDPSNFFAQFAVDTENVLEIYPEFEVVAGSADEFLSDRGTCLIGDGLVSRFGWKIGDTVPLIGTIFPRAGGGAWEFRVAAIYHSTAANIDNATMYFHFDYLRESLETGAAYGQPGVGVYVLRLTPGAKAEAVMARVDRLFENGPQRVQTTTEAEFSRQFVTMLGNVPTFIASIGGGVLFAILLAVLNTMLLAARERTHDFGILKALGFGDGTVFALLLVESLLLCALGGILGIVLARGVEPAFRAVFGAFLPGFGVTGETILLALMLSIAVGVLAGIVPALQARRLRAVDALRAEV